MVTYTDKVKQLTEDIAQIQNELIWINQQLARHSIAIDSAENEMQRLEQRREIFIVDLYDAENDLNELLADQAGC